VIFLKKKNKNALVIAMALSMGTAVVAPVIANTIQADAMGAGVFGEKAKVKTTHNYYSKSGSKFVKKGLIMKGTKYTVGNSYQSGYYKVSIQGKTYYMKSADVLKDL
jgi:hypothetical protein